MPRRVQPQRRRVLCRVWRHRRMVARAQPTGWHPPSCKGQVGISWDAFLERVRALPAGQLWRHNIAGDLPGVGDAVDMSLWVPLVTSNLLARARGFTFTHKPATRSKRVHDAVKGANEYGFAVNLSADNLFHADRSPISASGRSRASSITMRPSRPRPPTVGRCASAPRSATIAPPATAAAGARASIATGSSASARTDR